MFMILSPDTESMWLFYYDDEMNVRMWSSYSQHEYRLRRGATIESFRNNLNTGEVVIDWEDEDEVE